MSFRFPFKGRDKLSRLLTGENKLSKKLVKEINKADTGKLCIEFVQNSNSMSPYLLEEVSDLLRESGRYKEIMNLLHSKKTGLRSAAVEVLGMVECREASHVLLDMLADKDETVRLAAVDALTKIHDPDLIGPLIEAIQQHEKWIPARVASVLIGFGEDAVDPLVEALSYFDEKSTCLAVEVLGEIGDSKAVPALSDLLKYSPYVTVRTSCAEALGNFKENEQAVDALINAISDEAWEVRVRAVNSLASIGLGEFKYYFEKAAEDEEGLVRAAAETALAASASEE